MGRQKKKVDAAFTDANQPLSGGNHERKNLALSLRYFTGKPHSWEDIMKHHQDVFVKFVKELATHDYGTMKNKGNYKTYPPNTNFAKGFNIPQEVSRQFSKKRIVAIAPVGRKNSFRIFGYVVEQHFCIIWFDPQHKALPS